MAHLLRLIAALLFALVSVSSHALIPSQSGWSATNPINGGTPANFIASTKAAVCALWAPAAAQSYGTALVTSGVDSGGTMCYAEVKNRTAGGANVALYGGLSSVTNSCPAHSLLVAGGCKCDTGYVEEGGACVPKPPECNEGELFSEGSQRPLGMAQDFNELSSASRAAIGHRLPTCAGNGCALAPDFAYGGNGVYAGRLGNAWTLNVSAVRYTGGRCTPSDKDISLEQEWMNRRQDDLAPSTCPTGKGPGTVNGTTVCMPYGSVAGSSGTSSSSSGTTTTGGTGGTTAPGDGSGSGPSVIGTSGPSNSSDTTITTCNGTTCTTTTTSQGSAQAGTGTGAGGTGTGGTGTGSQECAKAAASGASAPAGGATCTNTTTTTQSQAEFCSKPENKKNVACVNDKGQSSFGGGCASGFKAQSDDAVINAMAEETFRQNCKVNPDDASQVLGRTEAAKTGNQTGDNPNNSAVSIGAGSFDNSNALGGVAGCIADKSIVVMGKSVNIAFSMICQYLEALGLVMVGVSSLLAARILTRG